MAEAIRLHDRKSKDYGSDEDPLANIRASVEYGVPPWIGCSIRMNDKEHRLRRFAIRGDLANESARDSMMDNIVYGPIRVQLYEEETE